MNVTEGYGWRIDAPSNVRDTEPRLPACPTCGESASDPVFTKDDYRLVRCRSCRLVRVANPPAREHLQHLYSLEAGYGVEAVEMTASDARLRRLAAGHFALVAKHRAPGRLLDVGCGAGYFVAEALRGGWDASGIDVNGELVEIVRRRDGLPLAEGRLEDVELPPGALDAVTLWDSLEHVEDPMATLGVTRRLVRPGGLLALSTPNIDGLYPVLSYPVGRAIGYWTHPEPPAHLFQFSVSTLTTMLERAGFRVEGVVHTRSPVKYTLAPGGLRLLARRPLRVAYAAAFLPALLLGPRVNRGDEISVIATAV